MPVGQLTLANPLRPEPPRVRSAPRWSVFVALGCALACGERAGGDKTVVIASGGDADILFPLLWSQGQARLYTDLLFDKLADIGADQRTVGDAGYEPRLATRWTWSADSLAITFALDARATWHDGTPVRAHDVQFAYQLFTDTVVRSGAGADMARVVDSVTVEDSLGVTVWYKSRFPEQFHAIAYNLVPLPAHLLAAMPRDSLRTSAFARQPVGNGPFRLVSWEKGVRMEFAAYDRFAGGRPKLDRVIFTIVSDGSAATRAVLAGDADFVETVGFDDLAEVARNPDVRLVPIRGYEYGFAAFSLLMPDGRAPHPIFGDRELRRALTMAVDRAAMVRTIHDSLGRPGIGPFSRSQWTADTTLTPLPFDRAAAMRVLDSLGWRPGADGVRTKGGRRLAFTVTVLATNRVRPRYAELLQQAWREVGVAAAVDPVDPSGLTARLSSHKFDAAIFSWRATPSPSGARQTWGSAGYRAGSPFNAGGYRSAAFDAHVDSGLAARDVASARAHFRAAYQTAVDDAPAVWLYEPLVTAVAARRVVTGEIRPDAWWQSLRHWDVTGPRRVPVAGDTANDSGARADAPRP